MLTSLLTFCGQQTLGSMASMTLTTKVFLLLVQHAGTLTVTLAGFDPLNCIFYLVHSEMFHIPLQSLQGHPVWISLELWKTYQKSNGL